MKLLDQFNSRFPDEESCEAYLKDLRIKHGLKCRKCSSKQHYWLKRKKQWQCKSCSFRTTLKSGTLFHASNLDLSIWFKALLLMSDSKRIYSAKQIQTLLKLKRYEPVWYMMHKIRMITAEECISDKYLYDQLVANFLLVNKKIGFKKTDLKNRYLLDKYPNYSEILVFKNPKGRLIPKILPWNALTEKLDEKDDNLVYGYQKINNSFSAFRSFYHQMNHYIFAVISTKNISQNEKGEEYSKRLSKVIRIVFRGVSFRYIQLYLDEFAWKTTLKLKREGWESLLVRGLSY